MTGERFVRVIVSDMPVWGIAQIFLRSYLDFLPLYCESERLIEDEFGHDRSEFSLLSDNEQSSIVDAEDVFTPDEAWAALAAWRLTQ